MKRSSAPKIRGRPPREKALTFADVRKLALALPGAEEGTSYGMPAFKVRGKLFARLREDGESLVVRLDFAQRETLMAADPKAFYITDHYRDHPMMLVGLSVVRRDELRQLLMQSWGAVAPKKLLAALDAAG
jgi:hypothetical protein